MQLLPQTWIVLSVFIISIIVHLVMIFVNQKYRQSVFKNSLLDKLLHFATIIESNKMIFFQYIFNVLIFGI